jgi:hypothetical protein
MAINLASPAPSSNFGVGDVAGFLRTSACSKPSQTKACRTFSTVRVRHPTASLIFASFHAGPSASALSKMVARRNFCDLPVSFLMVASQIARSSSVSRTIYFLFMRTSLLTWRFPKIDGFGNPKIQL